MKRKEKKKGYSCFYWPSLSSGPFKRFKLLILNIQFAYQRIRYGFCESDVWEINRWFLNVVPAMLDDFRESSLDFPECLLSNGNEINGQKLIQDQNEMESAAEKWNAILKQIKIWLYRDTCKNRGLQMFQEWFWDLWG